MHTKSRSAATLTNSRNKQGKTVWFTLPKELQATTGKDYMIAGRIDGVRGKTIEITCLEDRSQYSVPVANVKAMAANSNSGVDDMIQLQDLHEGSLLYNLQLRYAENKIYTFTVC